MPASRLTRRALLQQLTTGGACLGSLAAAPIAGPNTALAPGDDALLDEIEKACFLYFWEQGHPDTGLVKDRSKANSSDSSIVASIAATGFGLTALCIGEKRGWVSYPDARDRVVTTLNFLARKMPTHRGFFFHWANITRRRENLGRGSIVRGYGDFAVWHPYGPPAFPIRGDHPPGG